MIPYTKKRGFTLIELLVVISIIGLLSSVVLASLNTARIKARDTSRLSALHQLQTALELYHSQYGQYPAPFFSTCTNANNGVAANLTFLFTCAGSTLPNFIPRPVELTNTTLGASYVRGADTHSYGLQVSFELLPTCKTGIGNVLPSNVDWSGYVSCETGL